MRPERLTKDQFYDLLGPLDEAQLKKALWTLYWRGSGPVQARVVTVVDPTNVGVQASVPTRSDASALLRQVKEFAALARRGSYLGGDRRVSPHERTRWRFTFQGHQKAAASALRGREVEPAAAAMGVLIDLACELESVDYFRSDDAVEAARFVVSDAAAQIWSAIRREQGPAGLYPRAARDLLRWESSSGWTRRGEGWVSQRETTLAHVLAGMLPTPDEWGMFADQYLLALDEVAAKERAAGGECRYRRRVTRLRAWHDLLRVHLAHGEYADRIDLLAEHPALRRRTAGT